MKLSVEKPLGPEYETRRVHPAYFSDTHMSLVSPTSGGYYGREGLSRSRAEISSWIDYCGPRGKMALVMRKRKENAIWLDG